MASPAGAGPSSLGLFAQFEVTQAIQKGTSADPKPPSHRHLLLVTNAFRSGERSAERAAGSLAQRLEQCAARPCAIGAAKALWILHHIALDGHAASLLPVLTALEKVARGGARGEAGARGAGAGAGGAGGARGAAARQGSAGWAATEGYVRRCAGYLRELIVWPGLSMLREEGQVPF